MSPPTPTHGPTQPACLVVDDDPRDALFTCMRLGRLGIHARSLSLGDATAALAAGQASAALFCIRGEPGPTLDALARLRAHAPAFAALTLAAACDEPGPAAPAFIQAGCERLLPLPLRGEALFHFARCLHKRAPCIPVA